MKIATIPKSKYLNLNSNYYIAPDFGYEETFKHLGGNICFGALTDYDISSDNNTGKIEIKLCNKKRSSKYPNTFYDNECGFSDTEIINFLRQVQTIVDFKFTLRTYYSVNKIISLSFNNASRAEVLFVLNMVRRLYRHTMSLQLKFLLDYIKSTRYDVNIFDLIYICDNVASSSPMEDDLLQFDYEFWYSNILFKTKNAFKNLEHMYDVISDTTYEGTYEAELVVCGYRENFSDNILYNKNFTEEQYNELFLTFTKNNLEAALSTLYVLDIIKLK